ncbi:acyl-CoA carboxylase subunit epsilon [Nocardioides sp. zg-1230]|uniref:acyl-CoA carboxylase subunit epsilon n=1 Tax=Nocardioides sp. zg-1230 TaxID=2736601 RepID=UPI001C131759|nr:acyl-CoA carboxylase subunit epsilon [Nocardioides sp. zg-1230]
MTGESSESRVPLLRVINADATHEEVAALVAVFSALGSGGGEPPQRPRPTWNHPARGVRRTHRSGPGAWRASGLPL